MQKACGIIAIALSASQFASAQTPDQSSRMADQSSALREEVKNTLQKGGFTNIRIMSESFLVRAIDQNGNPVVLPFLPDSQAIMPEASGRWHLLQYWLGYALEKEQRQVQQWRTRHRS